MNLKYGLRKFSIAVYNLPVMRSFYVFKDGMSTGVRYSLISNQLRLSPNACRCKAGHRPASQRQLYRAYFLPRHSVSSSSYSAHFVLRSGRLTKVDVRKFSKQFPQQASQEAAQGITRNVASGGSSLFLIPNSVYSGLQSQSVGIQ